MKTPGSPIKIGPEVIEHWYLLVPAQNFSAKDFYAAIEDEMKAQQMPGLEVSHVDLAEGGPLSDKREYLRMKRERLVFDICAAPVGVNYFFSYRFYLSPRRLSPQLAVILAVIAVGIFASFFAGPEIAAIVAPLLLVCAVAAWYFEGKDSYYRQDVRIAYCSIVSVLVKAKVEDLTAAKGAALCRELSYNPLFDGLYTSKQRWPSGTPEAHSA